MSVETLEVPEGGSWVARLGSSLPDFALALGCFVTWAAPHAVASWVPRTLLMMMLLEFVVVHSTGFMGVFAFGRDSRKARTAWILGLGLFYSVFAAAFSAAFHSWWPLVSFWILTLNRLTGVLLHRPSGDEGRAQGVFMASWGVTTLCYMIGAVATSVGGMPRLGFDEAFVASLHLEGGGLWVDEPWRVVAFGGFYFAAIGLLELLVFPLFARRIPARAGGLFRRPA